MINSDCKPKTEEIRVLFLVITLSKQKSILNIGRYEILFLKKPSKISFTLNEVLFFLFSSFFFSNFFIKKQFFMCKINV